MARIPESEIERIKREVSLQRLVESSGVELKKAGKQWQGRCPLHETDDTPSLFISPEKNLWNCLGKCGDGGDVFAWIMKIHGVSFRHAYELLKNDLPPALSVPVAGAGKGAVKRTTVRALPAPVALDADDQVLLAQVMDYYRETLKQSPEALAYLKARGLDHPEIIDTFKLGYANRTLGLRLPTKQRKDGADIRARLEKIGIYAASGHERYNGSLVIPVFDENGTISEVYGRKIRDDLRKGTAKHLCLPEECRAGGRGMWNIAALQASKEIILCEALIDAMTFWCAGYRNVTASYGTSGFTDDHLAALKQYGTTRVLIAYDRDAAGDAAVPPLAEALMAAGIECFRIEFPKGMDANEYALKVTPAVKSLGVVIRKAVWLGKGAAPERESDTAQIHPVPVREALPDAPLERLPATMSVAIASPSVSSLAASAAREETPLPASPVPPAPASDAAFVSESEIVMTFAQGAQQRRWRVRGLAKNMSYEVLKVNVYVARGERFHLDTFDLYSAKARHNYTLQAAAELLLTEEIVKTDLARVFRKLEELQQEAIQKALEPKVPEAVAMAETEREAALELLTDPKLMQRIAADFGACGIVGEGTNKLTGYLACVSRLLPRPLAVVLQSSSAAGKSSLMDAVLAFMPEEERVKYSAMTGQSLFYMGETNLKNKILAIVEEEGASKAAYALKLLQSEGELTIASTGKDPDSGNLITQEYRVQGPVMIFLTTTAIEIDEELLNRCLVLSVDEGRAQTEAIHRLQRARRTLQGLIDKQEKQRLIQLHQNAQRLLKPLHVVNPYADHLTFLSDRTRTRRDHEKYLTLIDAIALLHQHQRPLKTSPCGGGAPLDYIEVTLDDIGQANVIAHEVLGRSLDELPPQTRRLLGEVVALVAARAQAQAVKKSDVRFSRKDVRDATGWSDTQLRLHLERLVDLDYLLAHRQGAGGKFIYELAYDGDGADVPHLCGLIDTATIGTTAKSRGASAEVAGLEREVAPRSRGDSGPIAGGSPNGEKTCEPIATGVSNDSSAQLSKTHVSQGNGKNPSYTQVVAHPTNAAAAAAGQ